MANPIPQFKEFTLAQKFFCVLGTLVLIVGIGVGYYFLSEHIKYIKQEEDKKVLIESLSEVKKWKDFEVKIIGVSSCYFTTKWINGEMLYKFSVKTISDRVHISRYLSNGFFVEFMDKDGFKIYKFEIPLNSMSAVVDNQGMAVAYSVDNKISIGSDEYLKFKDWTLGWNF